MKFQFSKIEKLIQKILMAPDVHLSSAIATLLFMWKNIKEIL